MLVYVVVAVFCSWCVWKTHNPLFNYVNVNLASYYFENIENYKKGEASAQHRRKRTETRQKLSHIFAS